MLNIMSEVWGLKGWMLNMAIFLILLIVVIILQYSLLWPQLQYGFTPDDWWPLYEYKLLIESNPLASFMRVWERHGIYTTYQILQFINNIGK